MKKKTILLIAFLLVGFAVSTTSVLYFRRRRVFNKKNIINIAEVDSSSTENELDLTKTLEVIQGSATIKRGDEIIELIDEEVGELKDGDEISTAKESMAIIDYGEGTVVRLDEESSVIIIDEADLIQKISQILGNIYVRFQKILDVREEFSVETPTVIAAVRGTTFSVRLDADQNSKVVVQSEVVEVVSIDPKTKKIIEETKQNVEANFQAEVKDKVIAVVKHKLSEREKFWLELNQKADEDLIERIKQKIKRQDFRINKQRLLRLREFYKQYKEKIEAIPTPTPRPTQTPTPPPVKKVEVVLLNQMPIEGYHVGQVKTDSGQFPISCIGANKNSVRVVTDSANEKDCKQDCLVLPLAEYAIRNGGFAAMNGMYFCPADYPSCSEKKNTFDTLFFNSPKKKYINSDNNVYSTIPFLVILSSGKPRFVSKTQEWGRDKSIHAGIAGNPLLIKNGSIAFNNDQLDNKQKTVKANRGAFVQEGDTLYLCIVGRATVMDTALVYKHLGVDNAINIDGGGSSALWVNGSYKYGPGRNIPNAIVFKRK